jgi:DNA modification methylase
MIIQGDCIEEMKKLDDESIDICIFDLPFNCLDKSWDKEKIPLDEMWKELLRICKKHTPLFFFCTTKFGINLINTAPKKMPFRYDIVWEKVSSVGFLNARKMPMRKHEMIYVFYKHLPLYDLSSHKHKFIKKTPMTKKTDNFIEGDNTKGGLYCKNLKRFKYERKNSIYPNRSKAGESSTSYEPKLPTSVLKKDTYGKTSNFYTNYRKNHKKDIYGIKNEDKQDFQDRRKNGSVYDPPLPTSIKVCKSQRGKHSTQKPVDLIKWILKYYSKEGDTCLDITAGSGSTGVACKEMNRKFILIEKEEKFINIIKERLND